MRRLLALATCSLLVGCQGSDDFIGGPAGRTAGPEACAVYMVISGQTRDRQRMAEYSTALLASGLYPRVGGHYINQPRPFSVLEGSPPTDHVTLVVRFPSERALREFWFSTTYQEQILPLRLNPPAADFVVAAHRSHEFDADTSGCD